MKIFCLTNTRYVFRGLVYRNLRFNGQKKEADKTKKSSFTISNALMVVWGLNILYKVFRELYPKQPASEASEVANTKTIPTQKDSLKDGKTYFKDCMGIDDIIEEMMQIVDFLKNPAKYESIGSTFPKGILLSGEPGTGKTLLARALANEANCNFLYRSGADFDFKYVGEGAQRVRDLFNEARKLSPCIIFIDEIDSIGMKRVATDGVSNLTINQLLTEMDGINDKSTIFVLGATNRADDLDFALMRPGRFDKRINVPTPKENDRVKMLSYYLTKVKHVPTIQVEHFAKETIGMTGADIKNLINIAAMKAVKRKKKEIEDKDIEMALERIRHGIYGKGNKNKDLEKIATYQSAKAITLLKNNQSDIELIQATILPLNGEMGNCSIVPKIEKSNLKRENLTNLIDFYLSGRIAEEIIFGDNEVSMRAEKDLSKATKFSKKIVKYFDEEFLGITINKNPNTLSDNTKYNLEEAIIKILKEREEAVRKFVIENVKEIVALSSILRKKETLTKTEILSQISV